MIRMFLALSLATLPLGCTASPSDESVGPDAGKADDTGETGDDGIVTLNVETPPPLWEYPSIPVNGTGPAGGTLRFMSSAGGQEQRNLGADGSFCVDVQLTPESTTTVTFEAISPEGAYSDPVTVEIRQSGEPPDIEDPPPSSSGQHDNVAEGADDYDLHGSFEEGEFAGLVDGDTDGVVSIRNDGNIDFVEDFLTFELKKRGRIERVVVHSDSECVLEKFDIFLNDQPDAGSLYEHSFWSGSALGPGWTRVGSVEDGESEQEVNLNIGSPYARHFGIHFLSHDCGPRVLGVPSGTGRHKVAEIQVYAEIAGDDDQEPIGNGYPSCLNGGGL